MKIQKTKKYISAVAVVAIVLTAGTLYTVQSSVQQDVAQAYTSPINTQDPATAPDTYVVNFPDVNLKHVLNSVIASAMNEQRRRQGLPQDVVRTADQAITAGDMKVPVNMYGPLGLNSKNITNTEGLQFLVNATRIDMVNNQVTDFTPLRDLEKLEELNIGRNPMTDLTPLASIPNLKKLTLDRSPNLTDISPLVNAPKLKDLRFPATKVSNLAPAAQIANLEELHFNNTLSPTKLDLTPLAAAPNLKLINANTTKLTGADFAVLKNAPVLETLMTAGNNVLNLNDMLKEGFVVLQRWSTFSDQLHTINTDTNPVFENPVRGINNEVIPVVETANVKNVNADGSLNPNGTHIKLVNLYGKNKVDIRWEKEFSKGHVTNRPFSGTLTVNYNLPPQDTTPPTFNPAAPAKIVSREGVAININDVTADDNPGGSGLSAAGVTNNAAAINLNPANPSQGKYTLTYTAVDNQGNSATVNREIEITKATAVQNLVANTTDASLDGYTAETVQAVKDKRKAAEDVIANNAATQQEIDQAQNELNQAINNLRVDKTPLGNAIANVAGQVDYVKEDAGVVNALGVANTLMANPNPSLTDVRNAIQNLNNAINAAKVAEQARQAAADTALTTANTQKTPSSFTDAQAKINTLKDADKKNTLQAALDQLKQEYATRKTALQATLDRANDPQTIDGKINNAKMSDFNAAKVSAQAVLGDANASQAQIDNANQQLAAAIAALTTDKQLVQNIINSLPTQPQYIQDDPEVKQALLDAKAVNDAANPSVEEVRSKADALAAAIGRAVASETARQDAATNSLRDARNKLNSPSLGRDEMPNIDMAVIERQINAIKDEAVRIRLLTDFNDIKTSLNTRQAQINARKPQPKQAKDNNRKPSASSLRLSDTGENIAVIAAIGAVAVFGGGALFIVSRRRQDNS